MVLQSKKYYMITIDPLHIGSGGISLGKVDNPITLDPTNRLPKTPGTGISGAVKYFTDLMLLDMEDFGKFSIGRNKKQGESSWCASTNGQCGNDCLICYTFGYTTKDGKSSKGVLGFCDAHLILFPVFSSMIGRVWITSDRLFQEYFSDSREEIFLHGVQVRTNFNDFPVPTNQVEMGGIVFTKTGNLPESSKLRNLFQSMGLSGMENKVMILSEEQFPFLVQKNLEQRTSVAIDPETGAAKEGALFTFEAVPQKAVFAFQVNCNEYKKQISAFKKNQAAREAIQKKLGLSSNIGPLDLIRLGFEGIEEFGIGGMNTRGFGRLKIIER